jgi:secreted trypsin-like serine protease
MVQRVLSVGVLVALLAGCGPAAPGSAELGQLRQDIIGGTLTNGDPAVVALAQLYSMQGGTYVSQFCTGTLIGPRTILSAGHCVDHGLDAPTGGNPSIIAVVGPDSSSPQQWRYVTRQVENPGYSDQTVANDISVMRLESAFTGITPIPANSTALAQGDIGRDIRHVGYGLDSPWGQGDGMKRQVTFPVREILPKLIESGANGKQTCQGDSGGPGLMVFNGVERVAGVVSFGDQNCSSEGWDTRVDAYFGWLSTTMAQWEQPSCDADGQCVQSCGSPDPDCVCVADGQCSALCPSLPLDPDCPKDCGAGDVCSTAVCPVPDPDCVAPGETCERNQDCLSRACITDGQRDWYCTESCTATSQCRLGMECSQGQCRWPVLPVKQPGEACIIDQHFCSGETVCTGTPGAPTYCRFECGEGFSCGQPGATCVSGQGGVLFCELPPPPQPKMAPLVPVEVGPQAQGCTQAGGTPPLALGLLLLPLVLRRRGVLKAAVLAAAVLQACAPTAELSSDEVPGPTEFGRSQGAILGGTVVPEGQDREVFMLATTYLGGACSSQSQCGSEGAYCYQGRCMAQAGCTATLIASRTLLTAAHCVDVRMGPAGANQQVEIYATSYSNPDTAPQSAWFRLVKTQLHPAWRPNTQSLSGDVALALLDRAPPVTPKPWNSGTDISSYNGRPVRAVGYGRTVGGTGQDNAPTRKRQVGLTFILPPQNSGYYSPALFYVGDQQSKGICQGDSGGPTFHTFSDGVERLVGVHSFTANQECTIGGDSRTDYFANFIQGWLSAEEGPQCTRDGQCRFGCDPVDPDCVCVADGTCSGQCPNPDWDVDCPPNCGPNGICQPIGCPVRDADCVDVGGRCATEQVCTEKVCTLDQQHPDAYCSRACQVNAECPAGMECSGNTCKYVQLPEAGLNAWCTDGQNHCTNGTTCNRTAAETAGRCLPSCSSAADCLGGVPCVAGVRGNLCALPQPQPITLPLATAAPMPAAGCAAAAGAGLAPWAWVLALGLVRRRRS